MVAGGKARQRQVETGISDETRVQVVKGLAPGDQVVTGPYRSLRDLKDGDPVQVAPPGEAADASGGAGSNPSSSAPSDSGGGKGDG